MRRILRSTFGLAMILTFNHSYPFISNPPPSVTHGCKPFDSPYTPSVGPGNRLIAFGDSFTGGWDPDFGLIGYVFQLAKENHRNLSNLAVGGTKFSDNSQCSKIISTFIDRSDLVVTMIGFVDALYNKTDRLLVEEFKWELRKALQYLIKSGAQVYIGNPSRMNPKTYLDRKVPPDSTNLYVMAIKEIQGEFAQFKTIHFVDVNSQFDPSPENLSKDGLHPSEKGYLRLRDIFQSEIRNSNFQKP